MFSKFIFPIVLLFLVCLSIFSPTFSFANLAIPGEEYLQWPSIDVTTTTGNAVEVSRDFGFRIFGIAKLVISWFALIYMVLMGVYMVMYSDNEEKIKAQKSQFTYTMIGFIFLNVPGILYPLFFSETTSGTTLGAPPTEWSGIMGGIFWNAEIMDSTLSNIVSLFEVFVFSVAILVFTWWLFLMILSAGDEEKVKSGKNRLVYGVLGLLFLGFVKVWGSVIAAGNFWAPAGEIWTLGKRLFSIAIYFAGPVGIFFLIIGAYYYITSGGDEERVKKWKSILVNTLIASLILIASYSFLWELAGCNGVLNLFCSQ